MTEKQVDVELEEILKDYTKEALRIYKKYHNKYRGRDLCDRVEEGIRNKVKTKYSLKSFFKQKARECVPVTNKYDDVVRRFLINIEDKFK